MDLIKTIENMIETLLDSVDKLIKKAPYDKTFRAQVVGATNEGKYEVQYKGKEYSARCDVPLSSGTWVDVCAPQNNWSELYIQKSTVGGGGSSTTAGVTGVKGSAETSYRDGKVNISKENIGLGNVENKSSTTIRNEITLENVTTALGYTPYDDSEVIKVTQEQYNRMLNSGEINEDAYYLVLDDEIANMVNVENGFFTLGMEGWNLYMYCPDGGSAPKISYDPATGNVYYEIGE